MRSDVAKRWTAALRSGQYLHGLGALKFRGSENVAPQHCCLGVLVEIYCQEHGLSFDGPSPDFLTRCRFDGVDEYLPEVVKTWAGIKTGAGVFVQRDGIGGVDRIRSLSALNDQGESFETIADLIDSYFETL